MNLALTANIVCLNGLDVTIAGRTGPYDSLQMSDMGLRSVYSEIGASGNSDRNRSSSGVYASSGPSKTLLSLKHYIKWTFPLLSEHQYPEQCAPVCM